MFMQLFFFLKFTQRVTILQTVSNQEVTLKRLISILWIAPKLYVGRKLIYVRFINCSHNNVTKGIHLLDKRAFFNTGIFMQIRAFERYIPVNEYGKCSKISKTSLSVLK